MFTLLPEQHKKRLFREYRTRLLIMVLFFTSILFAISIALLFPSYISLKTSKATYVSTSENLLKQIEVENKQGLSDVMTQIQSDLSLVTPDKTDIYRAINAILAETSRNISIESINYTRGQDAPSSLNLQGVAVDRTSLLTFTNNLKKELVFTKVNLPISDLAKQTDVNFNITLLGKF